MPIIEKTNAKRRELTYHSPALEAADFGVKLNRPMVGGFAHTCKRQLIIIPRRSMMRLEDYEPCSDEELVGLAQDGDKDAFGEVVKRYEGYIYNVCYKFLKNQQDAEDCAQETFLSAWHKIEDFRGKSKFKTYITRIAINKCLNAIRGWRLIEEINDNLPSPASNPLDLCIQEDIARRLREAIDQLSPKQRQCIILYYFEGCKEREIAEFLEWEVGTVKSSKSKAIDNLKRYCTRGGISL